MLRTNALRTVSSALNVLQQAVQQQQCGWVSGCTGLGSRSLFTQYASQVQCNCHHVFRWPTWSQYTTSSTAAAAAEAAARQVAEPEVENSTHNTGSSSSSSGTRTRVRRSFVAPTSRSRGRAGAADGHTEEVDKQAADEVYSLLLDTGLSTQQLLKLVQVFPGVCVSPADYSSAVREALALQQQLPHLNVADLLARHPKILQVYNPQGVIDRLHHCQQLLQGKGGLSQGDAWGWLGRCRHLEKVMDRADDMVQLILDKSRVYEEVMGCPPSPHLFWRSSHRSMTPAADLKARLTQLLGLWGDAGQLHKALEQCNGLLNSDPDTVETKWLLHMEAFGLTQEEMRKVVSKWPRFATTRPELLLDRAQQLQQQLKLPDKTGLKGLLLSYPQILGNKGANMSTKLARLQEIFSVDDQGLADLVMQQPSLCGSATGTVEARAEVIQRQLGLTDQQLQHMLRQKRATPILTLAVTTLEQRIPELIKVLGGPRERLARIFMRMPTLICYPPATLERNIQQIAAAAGLSKADTLQVLLNDPVVLQLKPDKVVACMQRVQGLMELHPPWAGQLSGDPVAAGQHVLRVTARVGQRTANRMEFLLATGRPDEVAMHKLRNINNTNWDQVYPEYQVWLQARQEQQQQQQLQEEGEEGQQGEGAADVQ